LKRALKIANQPPESMNQAAKNNPGWAFGKKQAVSKPLKIFHIIKSGCVDF
jgi:hypothetical protein